MAEDGGEAAAQLWMWMEVLRPVLWGRRDVDGLVSFGYPEELEENKPRKYLNRNVFCNVRTILWNFVCYRLCV